MKKVFLFMAIIATVLIGVCAFAGVNPLEFSFADITGMGVISFAVAAPFAKIEDGINDYLKQIKENKELSDAEKAFAEAIFKQIGKLLTYKELSDAEKMAQIDNELAKFKDFKTADVKAMGDALQSQIDTMIKNIEDLKTGNKKTATNPMGEIVNGFVELAKEMKEKGQPKVSKSMELKTVIDMGLTTAITGQIPQAEREPGIAYEPEQPLSLLNVIPTGTTTSNKLEWVEKTDEQGNPAFRAEFLAAPQRSWKSIVRSTDVQKLTVFSEFSKEILEDVDYFRSEVYRDLSTQMRLKLESSVYEGNGTPPELKGILEYTQAWDNDGNKLEAGVSANIYDVIGAAITQIGKEHHTANVVMVNNWLFRKMRWTKDSNNNYIIPPFVSGGQTIENLRVVVTELVDDNELLVCDMTKAQLYIKKDLVLEMFDQHAENAIKDILVVKATMRAALKIKNTDAKAFVYCDDVAAAITALEVATT
jgi:HK97 family phage major capsid protein